VPNDSQDIREEEQDHHAPEPEPAEAPGGGDGAGPSEGRAGEAGGGEAGGDETGEVAAADGAGGTGEGGREPAGGEAAAGETAAAVDAGPEPPAAAPPRRAPLQVGEPSAETSFGTWLRRQREMREIELREIADKTKISLRYLKAMEQDRFDVLPAPVFARGFLREYARYVGLNPDEVVNYYLAAHEGADGRTEEEPVAMSAASRGPVSKRFLLLLLLVLLLAVAAYAYFYQRSRASREDAAPPPIAAPPAAAREVPPEPVPEPVAELPAGAPLVVTLDFTQKCWVEATVDGRNRTAKLFVAGESLQLEAEERVALETLGNAGGVQVQVNGEPYELPPAGADSMIHDVVIEAPGVRAGASAAPRRTQRQPTPTPRPATPPAAEASPPPAAEQPVTQPPVRPAPDPDLDEPGTSGGGGGGGGAGDDG
jgi:cytoskeletal protein RodZ